jgi:hypothetical protein
MTRKILNPTPGVSQKIGFYLAGMEEVREHSAKPLRGCPTNTSDVGQSQMATR